MLMSLLKDLKINKLILLMCDKLVFDLSQEVEGSPNVFVRKDFINILDNQNQNYSNNQSIIDTSQLSNSNKYMSYREAYLACPLLLSVGTPTNAASWVVPAAGTGTPTASITQKITPFNDVGGGDYVIGLKNWFGTIIHSLTLDYNGTTCIQQTPYINMWNSFKLMTSLSTQDLVTQGAQIGFYPDDADSFQFFPTGFTVAAGGAFTASTGTDLITAPTNAGGDYLMQGVCNNTNLIITSPVAAQNNAFNSGLGNSGYLTRQQLINFDNDAFVSANTTYAQGSTTGTYANLLTGTASATLNLIWKSYVLKKQSGVATTTVAAPFIAITTPAILQINVMATIKLKHIHSFFNMCPLLKGVFMKLTLNLNNSSSSVINTFTAVGAAIPGYSGMYLASSSNAVGGVNPLMISSPSSLIGAVAAATANGSATAFTSPFLTSATAGGTFRIQTYFNISVGATCLDQTIAGISGVVKGALAQSIYLYIPAYTFNPTFEQAYLSTPIKQIKYTDVYQYQITNVSSGGFINNLITNGIANIKSVLVLPFYSPLGGAAQANTKSGLSFNTNTHITQGMPVWQSPFDCAGTGCTSPMSHITNFNVQISGQNAIYNLQKYNFEQFNNQLYGQNSVNGGLTDGLTSGLIGRHEFDMNYCYYYVNVERMLPVEESVPKSVQIIGQNISSKTCDYYVFVEYGNLISIDALTGARV